MKQWLARMKAVSRERRRPWKLDPAAFIAVMLCEFLILAALLFVPYWLFSVMVADIIFWGGLMALVGWFSYWTRSRNQNAQPHTREAAQHRKRAP